MIEQNKTNLEGFPPPETPKEENSPETFRTPEQVAVHDREAAKISSTSAFTSNSTSKGTINPISGKNRWHEYSKRKKILIALLALLIIVGIVVGILYALTSHKPQPKPTVIKKPTVSVAPTPKSNLVPSTLTGLPVNPSVNNRPVTGVMIENYLDARPQSGLDQAGVVFEAIAEAGITRFLALYQDTQPDYIGPVRSARPYYVQWCLGFDCDYAHVGGSPEALYDIPAWKVHDMNQFYYSGYYERITSRYAPHNVYTSISQLNSLESKLGFGAPSYTGFARKADSPAKNPTVTTVNFNISGPDYADKFVYNPSNNNYTRYQAGAPHTELTKSGKLVDITPKVVIGIVMKYNLESDNYHSHYAVISTGKAYIFQDGKVEIGTWIKPHNNSQIRFLDSQNKPIALDAGQTWITALSDPSEITYN